MSQEQTDLIEAHATRDRLRKYAKERGLVSILKKIVKHLGNQDKTIAGYYTLIQKNVEIRYQGVGVSVYICLPHQQKKLVFSGNEQEIGTFHRGDWESIFLLENNANERERVRDLRNTLAEIKKIADNFSNGASHDANND